MLSLQQNSFPFPPPIHFATDPRTVGLPHLPSISAPSTSSSTSTTLNLEATLTSVPSLLSVRAVTPTPGLNVVPSPVPFFSVSPLSPNTPSSPTSSSAFLASASLLNNFRPSYFNNSPSTSLSPGLEPGSRSCSPTTPFTQREATPPKESSMESSVVQAPEPPPSANLKLGPPLKRPKILQRRRREKKSSTSSTATSKKTTSEAKKKPSKRAKSTDAAVASLLSIASAGSLDATAASLPTSPATSRRKSSSPSPSPTDSPKTGDGTTAKPEKSTKTGRTCIYCGTSNTPEWRRGPDGNKSLCNACGLHFAKIVRKERESATAPTTESPASVREKCSVSKLLS